MFDWVVSKGSDIAGRGMGTLILTRAYWRRSGGADVCRLQAIDCQLMARRMQRAHDVGWSQTTHAVEAVLCRDVRANHTAD